jgi:hypothetical protein
VHRIAFELVVVVECEDERSLERLELGDQDGQHLADQVDTGRPQERQRPRAEFRRHRPQGLEGVGPEADWIAVGRIERHPGKPALPVL